MLRLRERKGSAPSPVRAKPMARSTAWEAALSGSALAANCSSPSTRSPQSQSAPAASRAMPWRQNFRPTQ